MTVPTQAPTQKDPAQSATAAAASAPSATAATVATEAAAPAAALIPGPFRTLGGGIKNFFVSLKTAFKNPKTLIPALLLAVVWLVLSILDSAGVQAKYLDTASFLTFAKGGISNSVSVIVGGILGKGLIAGAVTSLILSFTRKNKGKKVSLIQKIKGSLGVSGDCICPYLFGMGLAALLYRFISGGDVKGALMAGLATSYVAGKSALSGGFLSRFVSSLTSKGKAKAGPGAGGFVRGIALGSALAAGLGQLDKPVVILILGAALTLIGLVLTILQAAKPKNPGKEGQA